jgi:hypothetical protein
MYLTIKLYHYQKLAALELPAQIWQRYSTYNRCYYMGTQCLSSLSF